MDTLVNPTTQDDNATDPKRIQTGQRNILDFSDCVLSIILLYLKPYDLYRLSKTCTRFKYLIKERKLWRRLDVLDHPMCARKFKFFFDHVNNSTDTVMVSGICKKEKTLTFSQFNKMYKICDNLTILAIENQYINSDEIGLKDFPKSLKELSLRGTHIYGRTPFLQDANLRLHKLHTLILDDCKWFHEHSLMALSKLCSLENLSLYKCGNLNDSVAYMSITAKFGFRKLLRIDARCTSIGDQFLKCFHCIKTLREIYLEAPQRREVKKKPLFDEIKRLCATDMQETTSAVVFNRSNIFKMRRDRAKSKKPRRLWLPNQQTPQNDCDFNCLTSCENCTPETCGYLPHLTSNFSTSDPQISGQVVQDPEVKPERRQSVSSNPEDSEGQPFEIFFCDDVSDSEDEMVDFEIFHSDVTDSGVQWFCTSDPDATDNLGHESLLFRKPFKECTCMKKDPSGGDLDKAGPSGLNNFPGPSKRKHSPPPKDFKNKLVVREAPTNPNECSTSGEASNSTDHAPSNETGANIPRTRAVRLQIGYGSSDDESDTDPTDPPTNQRPAVSLATNQNPSNNLEPIMIHPAYALNNPANGNAANARPANQQALETRAIYQQVVNHQNALQAANRIAGFRQDAQPRLVNDRFIVCEQNRLLQPLRGRDLRVIIERLDPGVHIVYDQGGRVQFDNYMKDYTTKLKVFVARGYKLITNHALMSLMDLRLELLDVTGTSVSAMGVREFLLVNPDCRVIHESTCCCN